MSGTRITDQQVRLYMSKRKHHSQEVAAAKAGISVRSARRIERDARLPSQKPRRYWRSRPDPFAEVWDTEVVPMLLSARLECTTHRRLLIGVPRRTSHGRIARVRPTGHPNLRNSVIT